MREGLKKHSTKINQLKLGIVVFASFAGLVVAYFTPLQHGISEYPGVAATSGGIIICAMTTAAYINASRYFFLIAIPLAFVFAAMWLMLSARTLSHFEFYTTNIAQSVSQIPELSELSSKERAQFELAPRRLRRATLSLRHHLGRHAFWSRTLLTIVVCTIAVSFRPKILEATTSSSLIVSNR